MFISQDRVDDDHNVIWIVFCVVFSHVSARFSGYACIRTLKTAIHITTMRVHL